MKRMRKLRLPAFGGLYYYIIFYMIDHAVYYWGGILDPCRRLLFPFILNFLPLKSWIGSPFCVVKSDWLSKHDISDYLYLTTKKYNRSEQSQNTFLNCKPVHLNKFVFTTFTISNFTFFLDHFALYALLFIALVSLPNAYSSPFLYIILCIYGSLCVLHFISMVNAVAKHFCKDIRSCYSVLYLWCSISCVFWEH